MRGFTITQSDGDHLTIDIYSNPKPLKCFDWIDVKITVKAGGFSGKFDASLLFQDFIDIHSELNRLYNNLAGSMKFEALEEQLYIEIFGDGKGHFEAVCKVRDKAGIGNNLEFILNFDQTFIPAILRDLEQIIA